MAPLTLRDIIHLCVSRTLIQIHILGLEMTKANNGYLLFLKIISDPKIYIWKVSTGRRSMFFNAFQLQSSPLPPGFRFTQPS